MEEKNGLSFNCAESVIIQINREHSLRDFGTHCLRIASMMGGGIAGMGTVCGAVTGAIMSIGLEKGTNGNESVAVFNENRSTARSIAQDFLNSFKDNWGTLRCEHLKAMDDGEMQPAGSKRVGDTESRNRCNEYVEWASKRVVELLEFPR